MGHQGDGKNWKPRNRVLEMQKKTNKKKERECVLEKLDSL